MEATVARIRGENCLTICNNAEWHKKENGKSTIHRQLCRKVVVRVRKVDHRYSYGDFPAPPVLRVNRSYE